MGGIFKKRFIRSLMFISSYFPLYILLIIYHYNYIEEEIKKIADASFSLILIKSTSAVIYMFLFLFLGIVLSICSIILLKRATACRIAEVNNVRSPDDKVMDYVFTYILPILGISMDNPSTVLVNFLLFVLIWYLYVKLNLLFLNPLWVICGYVSYEYDGGFLITNIPLETIRNQDNLYGVFLANGIFLAHDKDNN